MHKINEHLICASCYKQIRKKEQKRCDFQYFIKLTTIRTPNLLVGPCLT